MIDLCGLSTTTTTYSFARLPARSLALSFCTHRLNLPESPAPAMSSLPSLLCISPSVLRSPWLTLQLLPGASFGISCLYSSVIPLALPLRKLAYVLFCSFCLVCYTLSLHVSRFHFQIYACSQVSFYRWSSLLSSYFMLHHGLTLFASIYFGWSRIVHYIVYFLLLCSILLVSILLILPFSLPSILF